MSYYNNDLVLEQEAEIEKLKGQLAAAQAREARLLADNARLRDDLVHIGEYWNQDRNESAMFDALCHIEDVVQSALAATPAQSLARHNNAIREECATLCETLPVRDDDVADECATAIRARKEPEQILHHRRRKSC